MGWVWLLDFVQEVHPFSWYNTTLEIRNNEHSVCYRKHATRRAESSEWENAGSKDLWKA